MGPGMARGGYRYSPPSYPPGPHYPGYTLPPGYRYMVYGYSRAAQSNMAVGLISVAQLSLLAHFSGSGTMTEVYNLLRIGRINNHLHIPGNK